MSDDTWPLVLLAMRIGVAAALYLFLLTGFNTLRRELGARSRPAAAVAAPVFPAQPDEFDEDDTWEPSGAPAPLPAVREAAPAVRPRRLERRTAWSGRMRWSVLIPAIGGVVAIVLAAGGVFATRAPDGGPGTAPPAATDGPFGPPVDAPDPGEVTVGLLATEDSNVRVTVNGVVQFDGVLRRGERQAWAGSERVQVWTDKGKTLEIAINGEDLGPYSPAMGHPDWNRIDFGFWPGWPG